MSPNIDWGLGNRMCTVRKLLNFLIGRGNEMLSFDMLKLSEQVVFLPLSELPKASGFNLSTH